MLKRILELEEPELTSKINKYVERNDLKSIEAYKSFSNYTLDKSVASSMNVNGKIVYYDYENEEFKENESNSVLNELESVTAANMLMNKIQNDFKEMQIDAENLHKELDKQHKSMNFTI